MKKIICIMIILINLCACGQITESSGSESHTSGNGDSHYIDNQISNVEYSKLRELITLYTLNNRSLLEFSEGQLVSIDKYIYPFSITHIRDENFEIHKMWEMYAVDDYNYLIPKTALKDFLETKYSVVINLEGSKYEVGENIAISLNYIDSSENFVISDFNIENNRIEVLAYFIDANWESYNKEFQIGEYTYQYFKICIENFYCSNYKYISFEWVDF